MSGNNNPLIHTTMMKAQHQTLPTPSSLFNATHKAMKKVKITYWICTGLMTALLGIGAISTPFRPPKPLPTLPAWGTRRTGALPGRSQNGGPAGHPGPRLRRLKEWAYAGLVIDLVGRFTPT
jgi:hypothetical protein